MYSPATSSPGPKIKRAKMGAIIYNIPKPTKDIPSNPAEIFNKVFIVGFCLKRHLHLFACNILY